MPSHKNHESSGSFVRKGQEREVARGVRGGAQTTIGGAFATVLLGVAQSYGVEVGPILAGSWVTLCILSGNALARIGDGRIGKALEDWVVRRLSNGKH